MNEFEMVTALQIDRLVDGELPSAQRRQVLLALDSETDGWRRLALAFLESQALRAGLRSDWKLTHDTPPILARAQTVERSPALLTPRSRRQAFRWRPVLAAAICGLLMFGLGRLSSPPLQDSLSTRSQLPRPHHPHDSHKSHNSHHSPETYTPSDSAPNPAIITEPTVASVTAPQVQQTLRLELNDDQGGPAQAVDVPVVENSNLGPEDLMAAPPVIPDAVQRALRRSGRRVYENRQLYEVTLEDGRRGLVPISDVFVENAGWDAYQ